jgi:FMN-dependent NADH-azoreductase
MKNKRMPQVGETCTFASYSKTGASTFAPGEKATITRADGGYVYAETADGRKIQTWCPTFAEYR